MKNAVPVLLVALSMAGAVPNVAMEAILSPFVVVDSGQTVVLRVVVGNAGDVSAGSFWAHLAIHNEMDVVVYHDSVLLRGLQPGERDTAEFTPWVPVDRDSATSVAWAFWEGDSVPEDDTLAQRSFVRVRRIGITPIWPPPYDTIDPGTVCARFIIYNLGNMTMTLPLAINIGPYFDTVWVVNLLAGGPRTVTALNPWYATPGLWWCRIWTPYGDTAYWFYVRGTPPGPDAGVDSILVPSGIVGTLPFVPQARYFCYGVAGQICTTYCWIDDSNGIEVYGDRSPLMLPSGGRFTVAYSPCSLKTPGYYVVSCSVHCDSDINRVNDVIHQPFWVAAGAQGVDVGVEALLLPDTVDSGTVIAPRVVVGNYGLHTETFPVYFWRPSGPSEKREITLDAGEYDTIPFSDWRAFPPAVRIAMAWTLHQSDENPANDGLIDSLIVRGRYLELKEILWPRGTVPDDTLGYPRVVVGNFGTTTETFMLLFQIGLFSARETVVGMPPQTIDTIEFSVGWLSSPGEWVSRAELVPLPADPDPENEILYDTVYVAGDIDYDVGVVSINSPTGTEDTTGLVDVTATVRNYSPAGAQTFWTFFSILDPTNTRVYCDSAETVDLGSGRSAELTFDPVDLNELGYYTARCSTYLASDEKWTNNLVIEMFEVEASGGVQESPSLPLAFGLDAIRPNPFRTGAATKFTLPGPSRVDLAVYSSDGRRVRTLACGRLDTGRYEVVWDGCDEAGRPIARSVYYLRFVAGDCVLQKKLVKTE